MFLTRHEAAAHLGVSLRTLDAWKANGRLPYYDLGERPGRIVRFRTEDLDRLAVRRDAPSPRRRGIFRRRRR